MIASAADDRVSALAARATSIERTHPAASRALLETAIAIAPEDTDIVLAFTRALLRENMVRPALDVLDQALSRSGPAQYVLLTLRAEARLLTGDPAGAAADAADALCVCPQDTKAKAILGMALKKLGRFGDALACLAQAVEQDPTCAQYPLALAQTQAARGDDAAADATLSAAIRRHPESVFLRIAAVRRAIERHDLEAAERLAQDACEHGVVDATLAGLLGHIQVSLGRRAEGLLAYADAYFLAPEDLYLRHLVGASGRLPPLERAPADYIRTHFQQCATHYDDKLQSLRYRVPGWIRRSFLSMRAPDVGADGGPVLDVGCGTGLVALAFRDLNLGPWVGIDLSRAMLSQAIQKGLYAECREAELLDVLHASGQLIELITGGDVLCFFGNLSRVFTGVARRLTDTGLAIFSAERLETGASWKLRPSGCYAHHPDYIREEAQQAGLCVRTLELDDLRFEGGQPVAGMIFVLSRFDGSC